MSTFDVEPGARVLWCLRRRASDVRCVLYATGVPVEVHIVQDRDLVLKEIFPAEASRRPGPTSTASGCSSTAGGLAPKTVPPRLPPDID